MSGTPPASKHLGGILQLVEDGQDAAFILFFNIWPTDIFRTDASFSHTVVQLEGQCLSIQYVVYLHSVLDGRHADQPKIPLQKAMDSLWIVAACPQAFLLSYIILK